MKGLLVVGILSLMMSAPSFAANKKSGHEGGGGDLCENQIKIIRDDLAAWIKKDGAKDLIFPVGLSKESYNSKMLMEMGKTKIRCVSEGDPGYPVEVYGTPKVCRFDRYDSNKSSITCSRKEFDRLSEDNQFVLIHHEYAGIAGLEEPLKDDSNYELSNQITSFLIDKIVRRLAVKQSQSNTEGWINLLGKEGVEVAVGLNETLMMTKFENCDLEIYPQTKHYPESIEYTCGDEKYTSQLYSIKSKQNSNQSFHSLSAGMFDCSPKDKSYFLYRDEAGKKIKWVYDDTTSGKVGDIVEAIFDLDATGLLISKASYSLIKNVKVNKGTIANPIWVIERQQGTKLQCLTYNGK